MTTLEHYDLLFAMRLERWSQLRRNSEEYFGRPGPDRRLTSVPAFKSEARTIVQLAFENRYASPALKNPTDGLAYISPAPISSRPSAVMHFSKKCPRPSC